MPSPNQPLKFMPKPLLIHFQRFFLEILHHNFVAPELRNRRTEQRPDR